MSERKDYQWENLNERITSLEQNGIPGVRDFFATSALSMLGEWESTGHSFNPSALATRCYLIADAMLEERKKNSAS